MHLINCVNKAIVSYVEHPVLHYTLHFTVRMNTLNTATLFTSLLQHQVVLKPIEGFRQNLIFYCFLFMVSVFCFFVRSARDVRDVNEASPRLQAHECRMIKRGYPVEPAFGPAFCDVDWRLM